MFKIGQEVGFHWEQPLTPHETVTRVGHGRVVSLDEVTVCIAIEPGGWSQRQVVFVPRDKVYASMVEAVQANGGNY